MTSGAEVARCGRAWVAAGLVVAATCACVPVPYAAPPVRISGLGGAQLAHDDADGNPLPMRGDWSLRAGVHPLQLIDNAFDRSVDIGGGYLFETAAPFSDFLHGAYLEVGVPILRRRHGRTSGSRLVPFVTADLLIEPRGGGSTYGVGGSAGVALELVGSVGQPFSTFDGNESDEDWHGSGSYDYDVDPNDRYESYDADDGTHEAEVLGYLFGEWGAGLELSLGYRALDGVGWWVAHAGITLRVPASFGVFFVWL